MLCGTYLYKSIQSELYSWKPLTDRQEDRMKKKGETKRSEELHKKENPTNSKSDDKRGKLF